MTGLALSRSGPMPLLDVEGMLQRLPAPARAELAWVKKPISEALARLRDEPPRSSLLNEVAAGVTDPLFRLGMAFWKAVAESPEEWRASLMQELEGQHERLCAFLRDPESVETLDWVVGFLRSLFATALSVTSPAEVSAPSETEALEASESIGGRHMARAQLALMAAVSPPTHGGSPERAHDLLDLAFVNLMEVQSVLRREGWRISPFPEETTNQRRQHVIASARSFREALSDDDWRVLDSAHLQNLR